MDLIEHSSLPSSGRHDAPLDDMNFYAPPSQQPAEAVEDSILKRLRRRKVVFAMTFVTVAALVAGVYLYLPATYRADAAIAIFPPDRVLSTQTVADAQMTIGDEADLASQVAILSSPMLIRQLLDKPGIVPALIKECEAARPPAWKQAIKDLLHFKPYPSCPELMGDKTFAVSAIHDRLNVAVNGRSRVIDIAFNSRFPDVAQLVANGITQTYLDYRLQEKLQPRDQAIQWLRTETQRVSDRLNATETRIQSFLQARGVVNGQVAPIASEQLTSLAQQLAVAEADRATAAGRVQQAHSGGITTGILDNRSVSDVKQQLSQVTAQLAQLSARFGRNYPEVIALEEQRRTLAGLLGQETSTVTRSATGDYQAASSRVASLRQQMDSLKQEVRGNDDAATQVASLQRDAVADRQLYVDLSKNLNQLETDRRLVTSDSSLVNMAELPQGVFFPKVTSFALAGLLLAGAAAVVSALLRDYADRTLRGVTGASDLSSMRVLACIPHVTRIGRGSTRLERRIQNPSEFQEAIRGLYAECLLIGAGSGRGRMLRSILLSSSNGGEGKSMTTLALAHFAAAAGQRVLLLECDLRRPSVRRSLSLPSQAGVSEILRGLSTPEQVVCPCRPGLDVILAGKPSVDSTELLGSERLKPILAWATTNYDLVLIDAPSSRLLPDARILAPHVDGILYCAKWGYSHTDAVVNGVSELKAAGGRIIGIVLNQVERAHYRLYDTNSVRAGSYSVALEH